MDYSDLELMGVVVQCTTGVLLLLLFFRLGRFGARRRVLYTWMLAWAVQTVSIAGFVIQSIALLLRAPLAPSHASVLLDDCYVPAKLLFAGLAAIGALRAVGRPVSLFVERLVAALAITAGALLVVAGMPLVTGAVQGAVTMGAFVGVGLVVARHEVRVPGRRIPFVALSMALFGAVTLLYQGAYYFDWDGWAAGHAVHAFANTSGYGDALILAILGGAIVVQIIDDAFRAAEQARDAQLHATARSEARLVGIIDAAREALMTITGDGTITLANATAEARFGLPPRGALGLDLSRLLHTDEPLMPQIRRAIALSADRDRLAVTLAGQGHRQDGSVFPVEFTVGSLQSDDDTGCVVVLRDLSAQHAAKSEREQFERRMAESEKMLAIGRVVSGVAHELNNPLAVVLGQSEQLVDAAMDDDARSGLRLINEQAHRARHIVRDLLMFVRHRDEPRETVDVARIIQRMVASQRAAARVRGVTLVTQLASYVPPVLADRNGIEQVLVNLVDNAFDAAGEGGRVRITLVAVPGAAEVSVEDTGPGVPDDVADRIFEPFFTTKPIGHGTGLGLPVSLGVAERNGGTLRLENRPAHGVGARFVLTIPFSTNAVAPEVTPPPAPRTITLPTAPLRPDGSPAAVLLIDDEAAVRSTLARIFRRGGWNVSEASTGAEGLTKLLDAPDAKLPAVILCDLKMPGMGGRDVYLHLQERRPALLSRLVFVTGDIVETSAAAFIGSTEALVVEKPFTVSEIAAAVEQVLKHHGEVPPRTSP